MIPADVAADRLLRLAVQRDFFLAERDHWEYLAGFGLPGALFLGLDPSARVKHYDDMIGRIDEQVAEVRLQTAACGSPAGQE
jgi:hypothetical protein